LQQSDLTRSLSDAIDIVSCHVAKGETVALESWGWDFPDQEYPVNRVYFANQPSRCLANVIWDGIHRRYWFSGIRLEALIQHHDHYRPPMGSLPVFRRQVTDREVQEFMSLYPNPHDKIIRRLLEP
jgi:hypothetical protein